MTRDISNTYLNVASCKKVYGKEGFGGEYEDYKANILQALYGLKLSSTSCRNHSVFISRGDLSSISCFVFVKCFPLSDSQYQY